MSGKEIMEQFMRELREAEVSKKNKKKRHGKMVETDIDIFADEKE